MAARFTYQTWHPHSKACTGGSTSDHVIATGGSARPLHIRPTLKYLRPIRLRALEYSPNLRRLPASLLQVRWLGRIELEVECSKPLGITNQPLSRRSLSPITLKLKTTLAGRLVPRPRPWFRSPAWAAHLPCGRPRSAPPLRCRGFRPLPVPELSCRRASRLRDRDIAIRPRSRGSLRRQGTH